MSYGLLLFCVITNSTTVIPMYFPSHYVCYADRFNANFILKTYVHIGLETNWFIILFYLLKCVKFVWVLLFVPLQSSFEFFGVPSLAVTFNLPVHMSPSNGNPSEYLNDVLDQLHLYLVSLICLVVDSWEG